MPALGALSILVLGGCSTITQGTDQDILINTNPAGARCDLVRQGKIIAVADITPKTVNVSMIAAGKADQGRLELRWMLF